MEGAWHDTPHPPDPLLSPWGEGGDTLAGVSDTLPLDLALRGGTIVTGDSVGKGDIGIRGGRIVQLGEVGPAEREIDVSGKEILPGGIDMHVHLTPGELPDGTYHHADDFLS